MRALQELVLMVHNNSLGFPGFLAGPGQQEHLLQSLYDGIVRGDFQDDRTASEKLHLGDSNGAAYQSLRRTLRDHLINSVFFFDMRRSEYNDRQKAYFKAYKDWAAAKILLGKNAYAIGIDLCKKVLNTALKFEFIDLAVDVLRILRLHYGTREGSHKKFEEYNKLFLKYDATLHEENKAEGYYIELVLHYVKSRALASDTAEKARQMLEELEPLLSEHPTYRLQLCVMLIKLEMYSSLNDLQKTIDVCEEYLHLFFAKPYDANVPIQICYYQELICYTQLRNYAQGKVAAEQCLAYLDEGSFNWFKYQELYFVLSMHTHNYQDAYRVFLQTVEHKRFKFLPPSLLEIWKIYEAYLYYLVSLKKVEPDSKGDSHFARFRMNKFLNETPIFSQDRRGMNIPILVIQILFMIHSKQNDQAIDRIEAINKYCFRYLRQDETFRSNSFIKMLLTIPENSFHRAAVLRKAERYYQKMKEFPQNLAAQSYEVEVIPDEDLWEFVVETLENTHYRSRSKS